MINMNTPPLPFPPTVIIMTMMGKVMTWTLPPLSGGTAGHSGRRYSCNSFVIIIMIAMLIVTMKIMMIMIMIIMTIMINIIIIMAILMIMFFFCFASRH